MLGWNTACVHGATPIDEMPWIITPAMTAGNAEGPNSLLSPRRLQTPFKGRGAGRRSLAEEEEGLQLHSASKRIIILALIVERLLLGIGLMPPLMRRPNLMGRLRLCPQRYSCQHEPG